MLYIGIFKVTDSSKVALWVASFAPLHVMLNLGMSILISPDSRLKVLRVGPCWAKVVSVGVTGGVVLVAGKAMCCGARVTVPGASL